MAFSDPIATTQPHFTTNTNDIITPNSWFGPALATPFPTNAWFMDFIIDPSSDQVSSNGDRRTTVWPYYIRARSNGLDVNKPFIRLYSDNRTLRNEYQINYDSTATNYGWTSDSDPQIWRYLDLTLSAQESIASQYVKTYDQLSCTIRWNNDSTHYMEAPIVRGMAYASMVYTNMTPTVFTSNIDYHAITSINGSNPNGTFTGTKFKLTVNRPYLGSGATETWILYSSSSITFTATSAQLTASAPFTGFLRLAVIASGSGTESMLDSYANAVPIGGSTSVSISGNTQTTTFNYTKTGSGGSVLIYALPHHQALLQSPNYAPNHTFPTLRGTLNAVIGNTWTLTDTLSTITWQSPNTLDSTKSSAIATALASEKALVASNLNAVEAYTFGKQASRAARLALIADQLGDSTTRDSVLSTLKTYINPWLDNDAASHTTLSLTYDTTWGGVVSTNALISSPPGNPTQATEFGNAVYNDHYFHWGYFIYAAAVIAHYDTTWMGTYQAKINDIIRDIANPSATGDPYFPQLRHYDWYEGHSWASGLQPNGDGRNQESTSEALNAWYGINLWGLATGQSTLRDVGRFLQAAETRAAHTYWQMPSYNAIYPSAYNSQKIIALVFSNKVFNATWFGLGDDQIVGIEMLPFTPATHELLLKSFVSEMYPVRLTNEASTSSASLPGGWLATTYGAQAIIDPATAYSNISALATTPSQSSEYIDPQGNSKTNMLWWTAVQGTTSTPAATVTTTTLAVSPASVAVAGTTISLTATVSPSIAGNVVFNDNGSVLGSSVVNSGSATFATSSLASGSHALTATFTPANTASYSPSTSTATSYTIAASPTSGSNGGSSGGSSSVLQGTPSISFGTGTPQFTTRTPVSDANYTANARDRLIAYTSIAATRTVTLPHPVSAAGETLIVKDESGQCSGTSQIVINATIDDASSKTITVPFGSIRLYSNGTSWHVLSNS